MTVPSGAQAVAGLAAWLIGTFPTAWLAVRAFRGLDLRRIGSGNIGATNVARVLGIPAFVVVVLIDAGKGAGATLLMRHVSPDAAAWGGVLAVVGHCWMPWLRLSGGKGVATLLGTVVIVAPAVALAAGVLWLLVVATSRIASVASLCAVGLIAASQIVQGSVDTRAALLSACLVVFLQHRDNLARLRTGDEPRLQCRRTGPRSS